MKRSILWINEEARPFGGCETYILNTTSYMKSKGWNNQLLYNFQSPPQESFTSAFDESYPLVTIEKQIESLNPDLIFVNRWKDQGLYKYLANCGRPVLKMYHDSTDFCLRNHGMNYFTGKACDKCLGLNCLLDLGFVGRGNGITGLAWNSLSDKLANLALNRKLSAFLVASDYMVSVLEKHKFPSNKVHKIPLFVKTPLETSSESLDSKDEKPLILYAGQLIRGKGVDLLITALSKLKNDYRALIVGSGNETNKLKKQVEDLGLTEKVTFLARIPQDELAKHYKEATCVVVPSRAPETFCLVGPEAMSYGTPVVGVNVGGISEWLKAGVNGILVPGYSTKALSSAIDTLLSDPDMALKLGQRGKEDYKNLFHINSYGERFSSLVESLIEGKEGEVAA